MSDPAQRWQGSPGSIAATLEALKDAAETERVTIGQIMDRLGQRAYGPLFLTIGLLAVSPIGAIPGASVLAATLTVLIALQMSLGHSAPWIPARLRRLELDGRLGRRSVEWLAPYVCWLDRVTRTRWQGLLARPALHAVVGGLCGLALMMYPLALVPWGVLPVASAIALIGLGLLSADGVIVAVGLGLAYAGGGGGLYLLAG
jgi:hypothetical protein